MGRLAYYLEISTLKVWEKSKAIKNPAVIIISVSFRYETSLFLYREEKSTEFSGSKKIKKKQSLQVQFHSKRTEVSWDFSKTSFLSRAPNILDVLDQVLKCFLKHFFKKVYLFIFYFTWIDVHVCLY